MSFAEAKAAFKAGRWREAAAALASIVERTAAAGDRAHADALFWLARARWELDEKAESGNAHRAALELRQRLLPPNDPDVVHSLLNVGMIELIGGHPATAEPLLTRAVDAARSRGLARDDEALGLALCCLGALRGQQGRPDEARACWEESMRVAGNSAGEEIAPAGLARINLGMTRLNAGQPAEAVDLFRGAEQLMDTARGPRHPLNASVHAYLGAALGECGRLDEAEAEYLRAIELADGAERVDEPAVSRWLSELGLLRGTEPREIRRREPYFRRSLAAWLRSGRLSDRELGNLATIAVLYSIYSETAAWQQLMRSWQQALVRRRSSVAFPARWWLSLRTFAWAASSRVMPWQRVAASDIGRVLLLQTTLEAARRSVADGRVDDAEAIFRACDRDCPQGLLGAASRDLVHAIAAGSWRARGDAARAAAWESSADRRG